MYSDVSVNLPTTLPLVHQADVMVLGGGPGGIGAAVAAARQGADVLLVEHYGFLGGMATAGEVNPFMPNHHNKESLDIGIFSDWLDRIKTYNPEGQDRVFDPNCARLAAEDLCVESGVRILYHHRVTHVERDGSRISHIVLHSKSGLTAAKAEVYIDSTGDGDLASLAGAEFEFGGENTPYVQPMTLCFKLKMHIDKLDRDALGLESLSAIDAVRKEPLIQEVFRKAKEAGRTSNPRENVLIFPSVDPDVIHFNTTRVIHKSSINGQELSCAEVEARKQLRELVEILRADVPLFKYATIHSIAPQIGIRESRRIKGHNYLTRHDYEVGKTFPDGIARVTYPIDIHNPDGTGTEITHLPKGAWYEIPYGCIVPIGIDNLLIGSRCISVDHAVHSSMRVMPPVCSIGQAAGTAAAMALEADVPCREVDGTAVKANLIKQGRNLVSYDPNRCWEMSEEEQIRMQKKNEARAKTLTA